MATKKVSSCGKLFDICTTIVLIRDHGNIPNVLKCFNLIFSRFILNHAESYIISKFDFQQESLNLSKSKKIVEV